jgi:hypothetical protein
MPHGLGKVGEFSVLITASVCVLITAVAAAPLVRHQFIRYVRRYRLALQPALPEAFDHE